MTLVAGTARRLVESIDLFLEADLRRRKARAVRPLELGLERRVARVFRRQGAAFGRGLRRIRSTFAAEAILPRGTISEALRESDWVPLLTAAQIETLEALEGALTEFSGRALFAGGRAAIAEIDVASSFDLAHPRAVAYLETHPPLRVAGINDATRDEIGRILTTAATEGKSYSSVARDIRSAFDSFATKRAQLIAITEIGDAYEVGNRAVVQGLLNLGLEVEKQWLDVGDRRVDPVCASNAAEGWIPVDVPFGSGHQHPTAHPGCRCTTEYRRKGSAFA